MARLFIVREATTAHAPIERLFLLSTCIELVRQELKMRPVRGRTSGHVVGGDTIRWEGWQLGLPQMHESLIEHFHPPVFFRDRMIAGRFATFEHDHHFIDRGGTVELRDEVRFIMPLGWPGALVGRWIMVPHIRGLMRRRFAHIQRLAEGDGWRAFIPENAVVTRAP
ncbi:MAG: hypothetical protein KGM96_00685 [Acidobacteriota bacterium]|nr:hypothetical protein [Acidobacteriota bacterium]